MEKRAFGCLVLINSIVIQKFEIPISVAVQTTNWIDGNCAKCANCYQFHKFTNRWEMCTTHKQSCKSKVAGYLNSSAVPVCVCALETNIEMGRSIAIETHWARAQIRERETETMIIIYWRHRMLELVHKHCLKRIECLLDNWKCDNRLVGERVWMR